MFGKFVEGKLCDSEHFDKVHSAIDQLAANYDPTFDDQYSLPPPVAKFAKEYLDIIRVIPNLPQFLVFWHGDAFVLHFENKERQLLITLFADTKGEEENGAHYLWIQGANPLNRINENVLPEDYAKLGERLDNHPFKS